MINATVEHNKGLMKFNFEFIRTAIRISESVSLSNSMIYYGLWLKHSFVLEKHWL